MGESIFPILTTVIIYGTSLTLFFIPIYCTSLFCACLYKYSNTNSINIIICFIKSKYKGDNSVKNKKGIPHLNRSPTC